MTLAWRARLFTTRVNDPRRGLMLGIGVIGAGLVLLGLLQGFFAIAAGVMGASFLGFWAHAVFTSPVKRAAWIRVTLVLAAFAAGAGYSLWRGSVVPTVTAGAIITLAIRAYRHTRTPIDADGADSVGFAAYLHALIYLAYAGLIFVWPRLGTYLLVVVAAGTLIVIGATMLLADAHSLAIRSQKIRDDARHLQKVRLSGLRLTGRIAMAGLITAAIAASFLVLGGDKQRNPGSFMRLRTLFRPQGAN